MAAKKPQHQKTFEKRLADIDRGHKVCASESATRAMQTGAIAAEWFWHQAQHPYDQCPQHKERHGKIYAIRGNWVIQRGLMNKGAGFTDEITAPAEESMCRCFYTYYNNIRDLPDSMLTKKGREYIADDKLFAEINKQYLAGEISLTSFREKAAVIRATLVSKRSTESPSKAKAARPLHSSVLSRIVRYLLSGWLH